MKESLEEGEKRKIIEDLLKSNKIKVGQKISRKNFLEIYKPYEEQMSGVEFAKLLEVTYMEYLAMKNEGKHIKILKRRENIERKCLELVIQGTNHGLELKQAIIEASKTLGIKPTEALTMLKEMQVKRKAKTDSEIGEQKGEVNYKMEQEKIIEELLQNGKIKVEGLIDYVYFKELYQLYANQMSEREFASILGISHNNYNNIKYNGIRTKVLKSKKEDITKEEKQKIVEELLQSEKVQVEELINYEYFRELYKPYANQMSEREFASILGISYGNYNNMKYKGSRAKVLKDRKKGELTISEEDNLQKRLKGNRANKKSKVIRKIEKETLEKKCAKLVMQGIQKGLDKKQALIEASSILGIKPAEALTIIKEMQAKRKRAKPDDEIEK